jgi:hypothetical protein
MNSSRLIMSTVGSVQLRPDAATGREHDVGDAQLPGRENNVHQ